MRIQFSLSTIYTFLEEIARMIDSEYIILYVDPFSRIPLYTYISCNGYSKTTFISRQKKCSPRCTRHIGKGLRVVTL